MTERPNRSSDAPALPAVVDRAAFQAELDALRVREKAHTREGDAIAAARRRLPMVEVESTTSLIGPDGPVTLLDAFEGRRQLIAYYFSGIPASLRPTNARAARSSPPRSANCPTCTTATSASRSSVRGPTRRVSATATSWAGGCPGIHPPGSRLKRCWLGAGTLYGRQQAWEDSPAGRPGGPFNRDTFRTDGRPIAQWSRLEAGRSDDLGTTGR
jgi:hypothetical protein